MAPKRKSEAGRKRTAEQKATEKAGRAKRDPKKIRDASQKSKKSNPESAKKAHDEMCAGAIMF